MAKQIDYIKSQVRFSPVVHKAIHNFAETQNLSFNSAVLKLVEIGLINATNQKEMDFISDEEMITWLSKTIERLNQK